nr:glycosyltransferase [Desulfobulbaceae bacterium]
MPRVSVIIPTYNRAPFLKDAIDSVLGQTYPNIDLIVVDDGSTDQTKEVVKKYDRRLTYVCQANKGVAAARNRGITESSNMYIAFLDSDDRFERRKIEIQVAAMQENPCCLVSHTQEKWFRRGQFLNQKKRHRKESGYLFSRCLELCVIGMSTVMVRREFFSKVGYFDETMPCCEDYDLWLRASVSLPFLLIDQPLTIKNGGRPDQLSVQHRVGMDAYRIGAIMRLIDSSALSEEQLRQARKELIEKSTILGNGCLKHGKTAEASYYRNLAESV